jgi:hypothetical protein
LGGVVLLTRPFRSDGTSPSGAVCVPAASPAGLSGRKAKVAVHWRSPPRNPAPGQLVWPEAKVGGERARRHFRDLPFRRDEPAGDVGVGGRRLVDPTFPLQRDKPVGGGVRPGSLPCRLARQEGEGRGATPALPRKPGQLAWPEAKVAGRRRAVTSATFRSGGMNPPGTCVCVGVALLTRPFRSDGTSPSGAVCAPAAPPADLPVARTGSDGTPAETRRRGEDPEVRTRNQKTQRLRVSAGEFLAGPWRFPPKRTAQSERNCG